MATNPVAGYAVTIDPKNPGATADSMWNTTVAVLSAAGRVYKTERDRAELLATFTAHLAVHIAAVLGGAAAADLLVLFAKTARDLPQASPASSGVH